MMPVREATHEDLDFMKFEQEFLSKRVSSEILGLNKRSSVEWAEHLKFLIREGERLVPTVAAILLFGKIPQRFFPHSSIDFIRFEGDDPSYPIHDRKDLSKDKIIKEIKALFKKAGFEVAKVFIHRSRSFGFVTLVSDADTERAVRTLNNTVLLGRRIVIDKKR